MPPDSRSLTLGDTAMLIHVKNTSNVAINATDAGGALSTIEPGNTGELSINDGDTVSVESKQNVGSANTGGSGDNRNIHHTKQPGLVLQPTSGALDADLDTDEIASRVNEKGFIQIDPYAPRTVAGSGKGDQGAAEPTETTRAASIAAAKRGIAASEGDSVLANDFSSQTGMAGNVDADGNPIDPFQSRDSRLEKDTNPMDGSYGADVPVDGYGSGANPDGSKSTTLHKSTTSKKK